MFKSSPSNNLLLTVPMRYFCCVFHSCACVYMWYASSVATFIAGHFAFFMLYVKKKTKKKTKKKKKQKIGKKIDVKYFMLVCSNICNCLVGLNYCEAEGKGCIEICFNPDPTHRHPLPPLVINLLMTVSVRYFCGCSSILHVIYIYVCVCGLQQYTHLNISCPLCFLLILVCNLN